LEGFLFDKFGFEVVNNYINFYNVKLNLFVSTFIFFVIILGFNFSVIQAEAFVPPRNPGGPVTGIPFPRPKPNPEDSSCKNRPATVIVNFWFDSNKDGIRQAREKDLTSLNAVLNKTTVTLIKNNTLETETVKLNIGILRPNGQVTIRFNNLEPLKLYRIKLLLQTVELVLQSQIDIF
jgi:hypothetical protein